MMSPGLTENPEHAIVTEPMDQRLEIFMQGAKIVDTINAIKLTEPGNPTRYYIPREDIYGIELIKFDDYHCPYKGQANLYHIKHGASRFENAAWSFRRPYDEFREIKDRVAFYPEKVQYIRITG